MRRGAEALGSDLEQPRCRFPQNHFPLLDRDRSAQPVYPSRLLVRETVQQSDRDHQRVARHQYGV